MGVKSRELGREVHEGLTELAERLEGLAEDVRQGIADLERYLSESE